MAPIVRLVSLPVSVPGSVSWCPSASDGGSERMCERFRRIKLVRHPTWISVTLASAGAHLSPSRSSVDMLTNDVGHIFMVNMHLILIK